MNELFKIISGYSTAIIFIAAGFLSCFYGKKLFKLILVFIGFIIGFYAISKFVGPYIENKDFLLIFSVIAGGIVGIAIYFFYYIGIFLSGCALIVVVFTYLKIEVDINNKDQLITFIVFCLFGGLASILLQKVLIIFITAFIGGWAFTNGVGFAIYSFKYDNKLFSEFINFLQNNNLFLYISLIFSIFLMLFGIVFQLKNKN